VSTALALSPRIQVWTPEGLLHHDFKVPDYFVDEIIAPQCTTVTYGARETGKTQMMLTLAKAMHENGMFLGRFQARPCRMAICQFDMPGPAFQKRFKKAMDSFAFGSDYLRLITGDGSTVDTVALTGSESWVCELREWAPDVVFFDSLRKTHTGSEIDTGMPTAVYSAWRRLFPGAGYSAAHHVTKPPSQYQQSQSGKRHQPSEEIDAYRGTTGWLDDADFGVMLSHDRRSGRHIVQLTRGRTLSEETKAQLFPVKLDPEFGLFLVPLEPIPVERLKQYKLQHPQRSKAEAVEWISQEEKGRHASTYYRWAIDAGYPKD